MGEWAAKTRIVIDGLSRIRNLPRVCVETGTCEGERTEAFADVFERVYSIEISPELHRAAQQRLSERDNVLLLLGDSAKELGPLSDALAEPVYFYLDAHWAGGFQGRAVADNPFPLWSELEVVRGRLRRGDVVMVDDVEAFGRNRFNYPEGHKWLDVSQRKIIDALGLGWDYGETVGFGFLITQEPLKE